ncbi:acyl carrier protein [uncultured Thiohalocapsa sp.]|uniref:acyl carrier protein n=1 Tax=uncultured Thiohalocapsa sp. TaxID=768990 RepID=UPI00260003BF|nr:acyl carrier protein [uncultured Thiohalocapsa sp.]
MAVRNTTYLETLIALLHDIVRDWDLDLTDPVGPDTGIVGDLGFESVDLMQLIVAVEKQFDVRGLPFDELLMRDGGYVQELTVGELDRFLVQQLPKLQAA